MCFHGWGRGGKRHLQRRFLRKRGAGEVFPQWERLWRNHSLCVFTRKFTVMPRAFPLGELANPQDLTERARPLAASRNFPHGARTFLVLFWCQKRTSVPQNLPFCSPSSTSYKSRHSAVYRRRISSLAGAMSGTITVTKPPAAPARTPL